MSPPKGLLIGSSSRPWRVGKMLGSGACGSVHDIAREAKVSSTSGAQMEYVVKIAPIPSDDGALSKRKKKKKKTPLERNADLLYYENNLYRNALNSLRGVKIPEVPHSGDGGPPGYGDTEGYRFLCMEKMAAPLTSIVPMLLDEQSRKKSRSKTVPFGRFACALVESVEALHGLNLIFVDVKPENFMLSHATSKRAPTCADMCSRLRMIDFGLVENFRDIAGGHREDLFPDAQFVGTPVYASLNVLEGHTASRRDDMEALGYVILELILMLNSGVCDETSTSSLLPWSSGKSDEEIFAAKKNAIEGTGSKKFFAEIGANGNKDAERAMRKYFAAVRKMDYSGKPDYDDMKAILRDLSLHFRGGNEDEKKPAATKAGRCAAGTGRSSRRTRSRAVDEAAHDDIPLSVAAKKRKSSRTDSIKEAENQHYEGAKDSDMGDFHSCSSEVEVEDMDWEAMPDENTPPSKDASSEKRSSAHTECMPEKRAGKGKGHIEAIFVSGPHEGESFALGGESPDVVTVGKSPPKPRSKTAGVYKIGSDRAASASHVKLTLHSAKGGVYSVRVTDLKTNGRTEVNGKSVESGKYKQAFIGNKICIGDSVIKLKKGE